MVESEDYSEEADESYLWGSASSAERGGKGDKKRRFSDEQVKLLEQMFESQTKLEPKKKLQLAKELGLHPRQVAIWFQNKRARWKSKQLEREYNALKADYDALLSSFDSLKNEKQLLNKQLKKLAELLDKPMEGRAIKEDQSLTMGENTDARFAMISSDDEENKFRQMSEKEVAEPLGSTLVQSEQQFCFHQPNWPPDHTCTASQWWELWSMNE